MCILSYFCSPKSYHFQTMEYPYRVRYNDVDADKRLRLYVLESWLLDTAGLDSNSHGVGVPYLASQGLGWVLTSLSLEMSCLPTIDDTVNIESWVSANRHKTTFRHFRMSLGGSEIGLAKSTWSILDITSRQAVDVFCQEPFRRQPLVEATVLRSAEPPFFKKLPEVHGSRQFEILHSHTDFNLHCNSCRYLEFMLDTFQRPGTEKPFRLDIRYSHELLIGDKITVNYCHTPASTLYEIRTPHDAVACRAIVSDI